MAEVKIEPGESDEEFGVAFALLNNGGSFASDRSRIDAREKDERAAGRTVKQRARKPARTAQVNFRTTPELSELAEALKTHLGVSKAKIMDMAILCLAKEHGLELKK